MNSKNIKKHLKAKVRDWADSIQDEQVKKMVLENTIITGGALVSLLTGDNVHDYDVYFRTKEAVVTVAAYYVDKWNKNHPDKPVSLRVNDDTGRVDCFVQSKGIADEDEDQKSLLSYNFSQDQKIHRKRIPCQRRTICEDVYAVERTGPHERRSA